MDSARSARFARQAACLKMGTPSAAAAAAVVAAVAGFARLPAAELLAPELQPLVVQPDTAKPSPALRMSSQLHAAAAADSFYCRQRP